MNRCKRCGNQIPHRSKEPGFDIWIHCCTSVYEDYLSKGIQVFRDEEKRK